jgi:uncharacterized protein YjiS (DUF1127 family)
MNMRVAKDEISLLHSASLSQYESWSRNAQPEGKGFFALLRSAYQWFAELPARRAAMIELEGLSDRELADIGLNRADVPHVYDADFQASYR